MWCGVDPGFTGALAFLRIGSVRPLIEAIVPMPVSAEKKLGKQSVRNEYDWPAVAQALRDFKPQRVILERQWARPREGVTSAFRSGFGFGGLSGVLAALGIETDLVAPASWKNDLGLRSSEKDMSRSLATMLLPEGTALFSRKKDHGAAEAALLVVWKAAYEHEPLTRNLGGRGHRTHALAVQGDARGAAG